MLSVLLHCPVQKSEKISSILNNWIFSVCSYYMYQHLKKFFDYFHIIFCLSRLIPCTLYVAPDLKSSSPQKRTQFAKLTIVTVVFEAALTASLRLRLASTEAAIADTAGTTMIQDVVGTSTTRRSLRP